MENNSPSFAFYIIILKEVMMMLKREIYLSKIRGFYHCDLVKILVGIRRCGKSTILKQIIEELKAQGIMDDHIIYINFENIEYEELTEYHKFNDYILSLLKDENIYYVFCDEIQNVDKFEKVINSLRATKDNISIFITGSNSKLLSDELSSVLSGRYVSFTIHPLSYKEYTLLTNKNPYLPEVFDSFMKWGGLPYTTGFNDEDEIRNYLQSVFDSIILRDVVERLGLKDVLLFKQILKYLIDTTGKKFSSDNILKFLKSNGRDISTKTIYLYIDALCKALIINKVYRYDIHGKMILKSLNKYYMTDLGISQIRNNNFEINKTMVLENVVYNELLVRGYKVFVGKTPKGEIDFLAEKNNKIEYYQVTYELSDEKVIDREFFAFNCINNDCKKYVLTLDNNILVINGIESKNIISWLLE